MIHSTLNRAMSDPDMSICVSEENVSPLNAVFDRRRRPVQGSPSQWDAFKMEMRQLITTFITSQREELTQLNSTMKEIQDTNKNIELSLTYVTAQNEELKQKINKLEEFSREDRECLIFLEDKLDDLQLAYRKTNFEIKGVPRQESETKQDLIEMVVTLSESVNCKISKSDIKDIYRVRGKKPEQKNTPIVVETGSVLLKTDLLKMAKTFNIRNKTKLCAKHLGLKTQEDTPIFVSENLTPKTSRLHFLARDLAKSKGYKFVWTSYGKIYIRRSEQSPIIMIKTEQQIKIRHVSRIPLESGVAATDTTLPSHRSHPEPLLDFKVSSHYEELQNSETLDISLNDYLSSL
ncbi:unnamed protein product [Chilo suppressalis]|uniref:FP protein C-terminal domain-containing protein n=1 Tax=Chilo suppressalis TaxID=168631 RepID=A0ABN8BG93_CHISP|nr:unnamed protein product [Chilo suppressalis]